MTSDRMADLLSTLGAHSGPGLPRLPLSACAAILGLDGLAFSLAPPGTPGELLQRSDERSALVEDLQFTQGQGPTSDVSHSGGLILEEDLAALPPDRWPGLPADLQRLGVQAVFGFPIRIGVIRLGVLTGYRTAAGQLTARQLADALALTDALARLLIGLSAHPAAPTAWLNEEPDLHRAELHQATGLVAAQLNISPANALILIRAYTYSHTRPLLDTARAILSGQVDLSNNADGDGRVPDNES